MKKQLENVTNYMTSKGYSFKIIQDVGAAENVDKAGLTSLLIELSKREVSKIVILNYDVIGEQYFDLLNKVALLSGAEIEVIDKR